jgi:hypothetical protein
MPQFAGVMLLSIYVIKDIITYICPAVVAIFNKNSQRIHSKSVVDFRMRKAALSVLLLSLAVSAQAKTNLLKPGDRLNAEQSIYSEDGKFEMRMQGDCNLVIYENQPQNQPQRAVAYSNTQGMGTGCYAIMQTDGNLVVYTGERVAIWYSNTQNHPGASAVLLNGTGVLQIETAFGILWSSYKFPQQFYPVR